MQYTDQCATVNGKILVAPASQKFIPKLILKSLQVTEDVMKSVLPPTWKGKHKIPGGIYTQPQASKTVLSKHNGAFLEPSVSGHRKPMNPTNAKNKVVTSMGASTKAHDLSHLLWEVNVLQQSYPTSRRSNRSQHLVKATSDSHYFTSSWLCAKWEECAQGTHKVVWFDGLKEFFIMLSCLKRYL